MVGHSTASTGSSFSDWKTDLSMASYPHEYIVLLRNGSVRVGRKTDTGEWASVESGKVFNCRVVAFAECLSRVM